MAEKTPTKSEPEKAPSLDERIVKPTEAPETSLITILVVATACFGGFVYGFSANTLSGSLSETTFIAKFLSTPNKASLQDGMLSGFLGGSFVGAIAQAPLADKFGRRICNAAAALIIVISAAIQAGSVNATMFIVFRVICGIGSGMVFANTPVYMSEVSPPHTRGMLVGLHGVGVVTAYILAAICALAFSFVTSPVQWRLIYIVLTGVALLFLVTICFLPESPRWLMGHGRENDSLKVLEYLHRTKRDPGAVFAQAEARQIRAQIEAERQTPGGFIHILRTPSHRRRALCSILLWTMGQATGITTIGNLVPTLMGLLGFDTTMQLGLGVVWAVAAVIGCGINVFLLDRLGRVKLLVTGGFGCATIIAIFGALEKYYLNSGYPPGINAAASMCFIFGTFFTSTIECTAYVYGSEIWPTRLRSEGSTIVFGSFFANAVAYSAPVSVALQTIGWKYYMVFVAVTTAMTLVIMFTFPETMGLSLEEINTRFGDTVEMQLRDALVDDSPTGDSDLST